MKLTTVEQKAS